MLAAEARDLSSLRGRIDCLEGGLGDSKVLDNNNNNNNNNNDNNNNDNNSSNSSDDDTNNKDNTNTNAQSYEREGPAGAGRPPGGQARRLPGPAGSHMSNTTCLTRVSSSKVAKNVANY